MLKRVDAAKGEGASKVTDFAEGEEGAKEGTGKEKAQRGVNVTDTYAFNDAFT